MTHQHYTGCHLHHFLCALERIRDLEREVTRLTTGTLFRMERIPGREVTNIQVTWMEEATAHIPCGHDHIEPPIHADAPVWSAHHDSPPSFTP